MSRSIHATRRHLAELEATEFGGGGRREAALSRARGQLAQKRRIKAAVLQERRRSGGGVTAAATIPVVLTAAGEHIHHAATPHDVCEVLHRLPPGILDGLGRVELQLGAEYQVDYERRNPSVAEPDPLVGRLGWEGFPGVWSGRILGTYHHRGAVVRINAYVHEDRAPLREVWGILLKLQALSTLVHEVGHHYDHTMRVARGRWLARGEEQVEMYAEDRQHAWVRSAVLPYLRAAYAPEVERLEEWVGHHGGVRLPLEVLAGDPRGTRKGGGIGLNETLWSMHALVESLVGDVAKGTPLQACRVGFARFLHYRDDYEEALRSLAVVLSEEPGRVDALTLRADIYVHQGRDAEALELARGVLARVPEHAEAWEVVADACEALERWEEMHAAASRMVALYATERWRRFGALLQRARASVRLGARDEARADLATLEREFPKRMGGRRVQQLRAELDAADAATSAAADERQPTT